MVSLQLGFRYDFCCVRTKNSVHHHRQFCWHRMMLLGVVPLEPCMEEDNVDESTYSVVRNVDGLVCVVDFVVDKTV